MVCASGGADSMALLHFLLDNKETLGIGRLYACHFNHGLRGAESDADEQLVRNYCEQHGVELLCGQGDMAQRPRPKGESIESFARALRYDFFARAAQTHPNTKIAVAHNQNDVAETALFNLARGTGIKGLRSIVPRRDAIIRPLLMVTRSEIEQYCREHAIPFVQDSTNSDPAFARNRIRLQVLPQLEQINTGAVAHIAACCAQAEELNAYIEAAAQTTLEQAWDAGGYDIKCLLKNGELVAKYAVKLLLQQHGVMPTAVLVTLALRVLREESPALQLTAGLFLYRQNETLFVGSRKEMEKAVPFSMPFSFGENCFLDGICLFGRFLDGDKAKSFKKSSKNVLNNSIDYDKITGNVILRNRRDGDRFCDIAGGHTKKLKKWFQEKKIAQAKRDCIPLLCDENGLIWVQGIGAARRVAVDDNTDRILVIEEQGETACTAMY